MKKVLLYFSTEIQKQENTSIYKKFLSQIDGFQKNNCKVDYVFHMNDGIIFNESELKVNGLKKLFLKYSKKIIGYYLYLFNEFNFVEYDLIFIRFKTTTPFIIFLLKKIKNQNPNCRIVLEFPTFPYHLEHNSILKKAYFKIEKLLSRYLKNYVDYTVCYGEFNSIYNIKSIPISNGYNIELENTPHLLPNCDANNEFVIVGMASYLEFWHGYDRILYGIFDYLSLKSNTRTISFKIIGIGPNINLLKKLSIDLGIQNNIHFLGYLNQEQINQVLSNANIGIGSIGMHRKNLFYDSSLKSRYFAFMGLPFILSARDFSFPKDFPFWFYVLEDESPIVISELIDYEHQLKKEHLNYTTEMNNYSRVHLSWQSQISKVLETIY